MGRPHGRAVDALVLLSATAALVVRVASPSFRFARHFESGASQTDTYYVTYSVRTWFLVAMIVAAAVVGGILLREVRAPSPPLDQR